MARNPDAEAPYAVFGALLDRHLREGTRPGAGDREPWTNTSFALTQPGRGDALGVAPNTVANWRKGKSAPSQIEPILRALFGPLRGDGGADREELRAAYDTAMLAKAKRVLDAAPPAPEGLRFAPLDEERLVIVAVAATDREAAEEPVMRQRHAVALDKVRDLVADTGSRLDNQRAWRGLPRSARLVLDALDGPPEAMADRLVALYDYTVSLASFIDQDDAFGRSPGALDDPLDADVRRVLADALATLAPWLRGFPTVLGWDSARRDFLARPELFETVRERLAEVGPTVEAATQSHSRLITDEDAALAREPLRTAERRGVQGEKSGYRAVGTAGNLVVAATSIMAAFYSGAEAWSPLVQAAEHFLALAEDTAAGIIDGLPNDVRAAVRHVMSMRRADEDGRGTPPAAPPANAEKREPPPDFDIKAAKRMILAGEAPPGAWVPFIDVLSLTNAQLWNLDPLRGLTSLKRLFIDLSEVSHLEPLRGLTSLQVLSFFHTQVSDLDTLRGLTSLEALILDSTPVSDLDALRGLTSLQTLSLNGTQVNDLDALRGLTSLQMLSLDGTQVSNLDALRGLSSLVVLDCGTAPIRDVAPLSVLPNLLALRVRVEAIRDWRIVDRLEALKYLYVNGEAPRPRPRIERRGLNLVFNGNNFTMVAEKLLH